MRFDILLNGKMVSSFTRFIDALNFAKDNTSYQIHRITDNKVIVMNYEGDSLFSFNI